MIKLELANLPPIVVHQTKRSRRLCLKLCAQRGLRLMAPPRASVRHMRQFVEQHRPWIEQHWSVVVEQTQLVPIVTHNDRLELLALGEAWQIQRVPTESAGVRLKVKDGPEKCIVLHGAVEDAALVNRAVRTWLQAYAKRTLLPWLDRLCQDSGLAYQKATARYAHTRWGSCSSQQNIMLNVKLLFLPQALVEYVMWHELCHTVHMNHSATFWRLVLQFSPNGLALRQRLRHAEAYMPPWLAL